VAGFRPLDLRNGVWESFKKANPGIQQVAQIGVVLDGMTMLNAPYYAQDFAEGALLVVALLLCFTLAPGRRR
jgi:hypothetical protein